MLAHEPQCLLGVRSRERAVARAGEQLGGDRAHRRLVLDDQDGLTVAALHLPMSGGSSPTSSNVAGNVTRTAVPRPGSE